jgi:uncharacterized protein YkwD
MIIPAMAVETGRDFLKTKTLSNITLRETAVQETENATEEAPANTTENIDTVAVFKTEILRLMNIERAKVGASPLTSMDVISNMADVRASESATSFSHTRPDGTRCFTVFTQYSVAYKYAGENLAIRIFDYPKRL